jgi:hypothetical protein
MTQWTKASGLIPPQDVAFFVALRNIEAPTPERNTGRLLSSIGALVVECERDDGDDSVSTEVLLGLHKLEAAVNTRYTTLAVKSYRLYVAKDDPFYFARAVSHLTTALYIHGIVSETWAKSASELCRQYKDALVSVAQCFQDIAGADVYAERTDTVAGIRPDAASDKVVFEYKVSSDAENGKSAALRYAHRVPTIEECVVMNFLTNMRMSLDRGDGWPDDDQGDFEH